MAPQTTLWCHGPLLGTKDYVLATKVKPVEPQTSPWNQGQAIGTKVKSLVPRTSPLYQGLALGTKDNSLVPRTGPWHLG